MRDRFALSRRRGPGTARTRPVPLAASARVPGSTDPTAQAASPGPCRPKTRKAPRRAEGDLSPPRRDRQFPATANRRSHASEAGLFLRPAVPRWRALLSPFSSRRHLHSLPHEDSVQPEAKIRSGFRNTRRVPVASRDLIPRRLLSPARRLAPVVAFLWLLALPSLLAGTSWQEENPLAVPRNQFAATVVDGKLYVYGGNVDWDVYGQAETEVLEIFDPATGTWSQGALGPKRGEELEGACIDGVFYVQFGLEEWESDDIDRRSGRCFRYTPAADSWQEVATRPTLGLWNSIVVHDGRIVLLRRLRSGQGRRTGGHGLPRLELRSGHERLDAGPGDADEHHQCGGSGGGWQGLLPGRVHVGRRGDSRLARVARLL